ncbi:MAG: hypothetical protein H0W72_14010, partial [Planctomycetes bacterium]|nr:hypothetical protein [Planctomycetota bacterium]
LFAASPQAASCALPSDARGLIVARGSQLDLDPWGAQALIDRGATVAARVTHADACQLWAGAALPMTLANGDLLSSDAGCPLGVATMAPDGLRLRLPSRLRRSGLR